MQLPGYLSSAIEEFTAGQHARLAPASSQLSGRYQRADFSLPALRSEYDRAAYLGTRLPATFAAVSHVFRELRRRSPDAQISSLLDLGAGPGTSLLAAAEVIPTLQQSTLVEGDAAWLRVGRRLAEQSPFDVVRNGQWLQRNLQSLDELPSHQLVVISYALGELPAATANRLVSSAWKAAAGFLVIVEPGTMRGFGNIHQARSALIAAGAEVLAPCPHKNACPLALAGDWCHFAQRVERTSMHRRAKGGALGYEDEKFSYIIASRHLDPPAAARIVRHPGKHSGHVKLQLCTPEGLTEKTVTKSNKEAYKRARQAAWGDESTP